MVDPNRKINRLTNKDIEFLDECEEEFQNRFTEDEDETFGFMAHCRKPLPVPPIIENWYSGGGGGNSGGSGHHNYSNRNHYGGGSGGGGGDYRNNNNRGNNRNWTRRGHGFRGGRGSFRGSNNRHPPFERERFNYERSGPSGSAFSGARETNDREPPMQHQTKSITDIRRGYGNFVAATKADD